MKRVYNHARRWGFDQEVNSKIGNELRIKREELGLTQEQLAEKLKITQKTVSLIENGIDNVSLTKLVKYAEGLGIEITIKLPSNGKNGSQILYILSTSIQTSYNPNLGSIYASYNQQEMMPLDSFLRDDKSLLYSKAHETVPSRPSVISILSCRENGSNEQLYLSY